MSLHWRGSTCGSVQPPQVKTDECKDPWLFLAWLYPSNETAHHTEVSFLSSLHTLSFSVLFLSTPIICFQTIPVLSQPRSNITCRHQRNPVNLRPISSTAPLSFFLCWSVELSVSCQQSRLHFRFFLTIHSQHLGLDWDLDSSRRLSNPSCPL